MSDTLRKQIDEPEAEQIDQECPAEQIDEPDPDKQIDKPDPTPSASATPEQEIPPNYRNRSTQTHKKRGIRSVRTQTVVAGTPTSSPTKRLLECPTFTEAQAVGEVTAVVTDIDNAQPLGELNEPKDATETCITTEIDFNVGSMTSSVSEESALSDSHIQIDVLSSSESDESSEEDFDFDKRTVLVEGKPPQEQIKFIIFEEAIFDVFGQCVQCGSKCVLLLKIKLAHVSKFGSRVQQTVNIISSGQLVRACQKWRHSISCWVLQFLQQEWNHRKFFVYFKR